MPERLSVSDVDPALFHRERWLDHTGEHRLICGLVEVGEGHRDDTRSTRERAAHEKGTGPERARRPFGHAFFLGDGAFGGDCKRVSARQDLLAGVEEGVLPLLLLLGRHDSDVAESFVVVGTPELRDRVGPGDPQSVPVLRFHDDAADEVRVGVEEEAVGEDRVLRIGHVVVDEDAVRIVGEVLGSTDHVRDVGQGISEVPRRQLPQLRGIEVLAVDDSLVGRLHRLEEPMGSLEIPRDVERETGDCALSLRTGEVGAIEAIEPFLSRQVVPQQIGNAEQRGVDRQRGHTVLDQVFEETDASVCRPAVVLGASRHQVVPQLPELLFEDGSEPGRMRCGQLGEIFLRDERKGGVAGRLESVRRRERGGRRRPAEQRSGTDRVANCGPLSDVGVDGETQRDPPGEQEPQPVGGIGLVDDHGAGAGVIGASPVYQPASTTLGKWS